jgi:hypothetical protein
MFVLDNGLVYVLYRIYKHWLVLIRFPKCRYYSQRYKSLYTDTIPEIFV